jgi:hypothetical protein
LRAKAVDHIIFIIIARSEVSLTDITALAAEE